MFSDLMSGDTETQMWLMVLPLLLWWHISIFEWFVDSWYATAIPTVLGPW